MTDGAKDSIAIAATSIAGASYLADINQVLTFITLAVGISVGFSRLWFMWRRKHPKGPYV